MTQPTTNVTQNPFATLRRRDLSALVTRVIHQGRGYGSTVSLIEKDGQRAAVKDFVNAPRAFRVLVAPYLLSREVRALKRLQGAPGVPRLYGRIDRHAIITEYIEGTPLDHYSTGELAPEVFPRVQQVIDGIHERGVSHGDLKRRSNLLLTPQGEIYLVDFAAATVGRRPLRPFTNWLQKQMALVDDKSVPRLKKFVAPELLTLDDIAKLENPTTLERWARKLLNR
jgi:predicted Ser/Thr protein kinase